MDNDSVRCERCGFESVFHFRFCGMCGSKLPRRSEFRDLTASATEGPGVVTVPSLLGLADAPTNSVKYLLEDEVNESHWGQFLVLLIFLVVIGVATWWRGELRAYVVARWARRNPAGQASASQIALPSLTPEIAPGIVSVSTPPEKSDSRMNDSTPTSRHAVVETALPLNRVAGGWEQPDARATPAQMQANPSAPAEPASGNAESVNEQSEVESVLPEQSSKTTLQRASTVSDPGAQLEREGEKFLYATEDPANCNRAARDLLAASEQANAKADTVLGTMYATGHCVSLDLPRAYSWFAKALQQDRGNRLLESDLHVLWNQMTARERQIATELSMAQRNGSSRKAP
jgi:hypothetical protein